MNIYKNGGQAGRGQPGARHKVEGNEGCFFLIKLTFECKNRMRLFLIHLLYFSFRLVIELCLMLSL